MKYKLVEKKFFPELGRELWQIEATEDFNGVARGERGGWIESEKNLSDNAWVYDDVWVFGNAGVRGNAKAYGDVRVYGNAKVCGDAHMCGHAMVFDKATVRDNATVCDGAMVYDDAQVCGNACVSGSVMVCGRAMVYGNAKICEGARVCGNAKVCKEILAIGRLGKCSRTITAFWTSDKCVNVSAGCFLGTIDKFEAAVKRKYGKGESDYMSIIPLLRLKEKKWAEEYKEYEK